jgi:hypothetical protein
VDNVFLVAVHDGCGEALRVRASPLTQQEGAHAGSQAVHAGHETGLMPHIDEACTVRTHDVVQHTTVTQRGPGCPFPPPAN